MNAIELRDTLLQNEFISLRERTQKAISDYRMINDGDRILVAISGGKDSLSAMHLLDYLCKQKYFAFTMIACNVDLGYGCANRKSLADHLQKYGIEYVFVEKDILEGKPREDIGCFWCSWNRRKALFETAHEHGCNKISLGHHRDDIIHTALMNLFLYAEISTSAPYVSLFGGEMILVRPLCYVDEKETEEFAQALDLPLSCCSCPQKPTAQRTFMEKIFSPLFEDFPAMRTNIFEALRKAGKQQDIPQKQHFSNDR